MKSVFDLHFANRTLQVKIHQAIFSITPEVLHQVFSPYGYVEKITPFQNYSVIQFLVKYQGYGAMAAILSLQGRNIYDGCCQLEIQLHNDVGLEDCVEPEKNSTTEISTEVDSRNNMLEPSLIQSVVLGVSTVPREVGLNEVQMFDEMLTAEVIDGEEISEGLKDMDSKLQVQLEDDPSRTIINLSIFETAPANFFKDQRGSFQIIRHEGASMVTINAVNFQLISSVVDDMRRFKYVEVVHIENYMLGCFISSMFMNASKLIEVNNPYKFRLLVIGSKRLVVENILDFAEQRITLEQSGKLHYINTDVGVNSIITSIVACYMPIEFTNFVSRNVLVVDLEVNLYYGVESIQGIFDPVGSLFTNNPLLLVLIPSLVQSKRAMRNIWSNHLMKTRLIKVDLQGGSHGSFSLILEDKDSFKCGSSVTVDMNIVVIFTGNKRLCYTAYPFEINGEPSRCFDNRKIWRWKVGVVEHNTRGFEQQWLSLTFSKAIFLSNGLVAILSGLFGNLFVDSLSLGSVVLFDAAVCFLAIEMTIILLSWAENFRDPSKNKDLLIQFRGTVVAIASDKTEGYDDLIKSLLNQSSFQDVALDFSTLTRVDPWCLSMDLTQLIDEAASKNEIQVRVAQLKKFVETDFVYDFVERIAKLSSGVEVIKVEATTETEFENCMLQIEDAKNAIFAIIEGIVHGLWRQEQKSRAVKVKIQLRARKEFEMLIKEQLNKFPAHYDQAMVLTHLEEVSKLLMSQWAAPREDFFGYFEWKSSFDTFVNVRHQLILEVKDYFE